MQPHDKSGQLDRTSGFANMLLKGLTPGDIACRNNDTLYVSCMPDLPENPVLNPAGGSTQTVSGSKELVCLP